MSAASYFFTQAAQMDPKLPYVYHELARISFLGGDFTKAMAQIDFQISMHGDSEPNSYYIRGLIEGYMGDYADSAKDYEHFLTFDPNDWAAMNDYSWVLLKANRPQDAADVLVRGLALFPDNPWLLNSYATALYELGQFHGALEAATHAENAAQNVTDADWLHAYPGNNPNVADEGITQLRESIADNVHTIELALVPHAVQ
jgi:tetratricopeptide (TPR) repeat protein